MKNKPIYGLGPAGVNTASEMLSVLTNELFADSFETIDSDPDHYVYFASPESMGDVVFTLQGTQFEGGFDGAVWPEDGAISMKQGGVKITDKEGVVWNLYRSDFPGLGHIVHSVKFVK